MADEDLGWICSECALRRVDHNQCERCGSFQVVLLSVVAEVFGSVKDFEYTIHGASWVMLRAFALDPRAQRQAMEEYLWFTERAAAKSLDAFEASVKLLEHTAKCPACRAGRPCMEKRPIEVTAEWAMKAMKATWSTLTSLREAHDIPAVPGRDTETIED